MSADADGLLSHGPSDADDDAEEEVRELERRLEEARGRLRARRAGHGQVATHQEPSSLVSAAAGKPSAPPTSSHHFLLLLADSALPLGSFAFSSGLESYVAHHPRGGGGGFSSPASFSAFLPVSVSSYAATALPFVLAAHRDPAAAAALDDALDAAVVCTVGRRASVAQGRALLGIWERSFAASLPPEAAAALRPFSALLRSSGAGGGGGGPAAGPGAGDGLPPPVSAHLAPLFGAVARLVGLGRAQAAYVFLLGHVKALVSAAVRAGMFGPYQAQRVLAGGEVQGMIAAAVEREWDTPVEEAGQSVPVMDLWVGRHEMLYSRIFNS